MNGFKQWLIFKRPSFGLVWIGQVLSQASSRMMQMALLWHLSQDLSHGDFALPVFLILASLPAILLLKPIGVMVDRYPSKLLLVGGDSLNAFLALSFCLGIESVPLKYLAYGLALLQASTQALIEPCFAKSLGSLVEVEERGVAVAFQSSTQGLAYFGGAVAGAGLLAFWSLTQIILLAAFAYILAATVSLLARFHAPVAEPSPNKDELTKDAALDTAEPKGVRALLDSIDPKLNLMLRGFALVNLFSVPLLLVLPLYVRQSLQQGPEVLGLLEGSLWLGLMLGGYSSTKFFKEKSIYTLMIGALAIFSLSLLVVALGRELYLAMVFLALATHALGVVNNRLIHHWQIIVPDAVKGRFFAIVGSLVAFSFPIGYLLFGSLTKMLAAHQLLLVQALGLALVAGYFFRLERKQLVA